MRRNLTFACGAYDRTWPLIDGRVKPEGLELNWLILPPHEIWVRMLNYREFEASEMSLASYLISKSKKSDFIAIPVFPARAFRHSSIYVSLQSQIRDPKELIGKRVAQAEFQQTAGVWARGILENIHDVPLDSIKWFNWYKPRTPVEIIRQYYVEDLPSADIAEEMLLNGELDAIISASMPKAFVANPPRLKRLFPNCKDVEADYFRGTGIFPIMHTVVLCEEIYKADPWIATSLHKAFDKAKTIAYSTLNSRSAFGLSLAWFGEAVREQKELLGQDLWGYGLDRNRHVIETLIKYLLQQGLIAHALNVEDCFAPNTFRL
ncbi:MAG: ABC transporter substrate-binding protein [Candidatus Omnitrophica bacterium]|nr:ABC transporter substrate-binding protein [Candidatus Omnitrophota bacterium]